MAIEAITLTTPQPHEFGLTPQRSHPNHSQMPANLINATGEEGNVRGNFIEKRLRDLIIIQPEVRTVVTHVPYGTHDRAGKDLTVDFDKDSNLGKLLGKVHIQAKSSRYGLVQYKRHLRDGLPEKRRNMIEVHKKMTRKKIALVNGSQTKSDREILEDSYLPQLRRMVIRAHELRGETAIFPQPFELMNIPVKNQPTEVFSILKGGE